jgi:pyruvate kinase
MTTIGPAAAPRRRSKIVCTLGPVTAAPDRVAALVAAGMDVGG